MFENVFRMIPDGGRMQEDVGEPCPRLFKFLNPFSAVEVWTVLACIATGIGLPH
jgi:hypothetical protein